ncbi:MAG: GNAT family N-acetyltransferase [Bacteroidota bacterium]
MTDFPILFTPRLTLRKIQYEDVHSLLKYANNKIISDRIVNVPSPYREPEAVFRIAYVAKGFKNKTHYCFSMITYEKEELIGEISLHIEEPHEKAHLGYWLGEPFWNQGFTTEAVEAVLKFGFEKLGLELIYASTVKENVASQRVLLKNGFIQQDQEGKLLVFVIRKENYEQPDNE